MTANNDSAGKGENQNTHNLKRGVKWLLVILVAILGMVLILGIVPASTRGLESDPDPAESYEAAIQRFQEIAAEEQAIVNDAGSSLLMSHDSPTDQVYVLIHGTTNSPRQFEELGQMLHDRGHNVLILRMPHHGLKSHDVSELKALQAEELKEYADGAIDIANGLGDEITVIGISGGGAVRRRAAWRSF